MSFRNVPLFPLGPDEASYRLVSKAGVTVERLGGREVLTVAAEALRSLAEEAFVDINHLLRPSHLAQLRTILEDPEATDNDRFVAYDLLKNSAPKLSGGIGR